MESEQDRLAAECLRFYAGRVLSSGGDKELARLTIEQSEAMGRWPVNKEPDL